MLNISGALLEKAQLEKYLEKIASEHNIQPKSDKTTYPLPQTIQEFKFITKVYQLLNNHVKQGISIHPAGEWLLDNYYIINENIKVLQDEVTLKQYKKLPAIASGEHKGYARIYILALEIIAHTDNKIEKETIENAINSYQKRKILNMQEMWSIQNYLKIAIIKNIAKICEKIYITQIQKEKVISVIQSTIENQKSTYKKPRDINYKHSYEMKYAFIEYLSYKLKKYGKQATPYIEVLEEQVNKTGTTIEEIINKQHYSVALAKVSIGNAIISLKTISRINFQEIFENQNGVEEILKKDPTGIYEKMSYDTKAYYRIQIQKMAEKTKISEIYVVNKALELAQENLGKDKKEHIGYYLIDKRKR